MFLECDPTLRKFSNRVTVTFQSDPVSTWKKPQYSARKLMNTAAKSPPPIAFSKGLA